MNIFGKYMDALGHRYIAYKVCNRCIKRRNASL